MLHAPARLELTARPGTQHRDKATNLFTYYYIESAGCPTLLDKVERL